MSPYEALGNTLGLLASILYRPEVTWATLGRGPIVLGGVLKAALVMTLSLLFLPQLGIALGSTWSVAKMINGAIIFAFSDLLLSVLVFAMTGPRAFFRLPPFLSSLHFVVLCWMPATLILLGLPMGFLGLYTIYVAYCGLRYFFALKKGRLYFAFGLWLVLFALRVYLALTIVLF